jgi:large subunit ribosomal protein L21e
MSRSGGKRSNTRYIFSQAFRNHGPVRPSSYLKTFKIGDLVDIKVNPFVHKGMPFKYYHGKTGKISNITKSSVCLKITKVVGNRKILKKINLKIEHVKKSNSRTEFIERIKAKDNIRRRRKEEKVFDFSKKNLIFNQEHIVSFRKIQSFEPEPYCVIV